MANLTGIMKTVLFNPTLKIYSFRILIIASIACIATAPTTLLLNKPPSLQDSLALSCGILIHHIIGIFEWKFFYEIVDWVLLSFEVSAWFALGYYTIPVDRWASQNLVILTGALYIQIVALLSLWIYRTAFITKTQGKNLLAPVDFLAMCGTPRHGFSRTSVVFGRCFWRSPSRGESRLIRILRAVLAIAFLTGLFVFAFYAMVVDPVRETGLVPAKNFHTSELLYDFDMAVPVWSIVAFIDMRSLAASRVDDFKNAINVTPLWDNDPAWSNPPCVHVPGNKTFGGYLTDVYSDPYIQTITIFCPSRLRRSLSAHEAMTAPSSLTSPDLLITVNFTSLGMTSDSLIDTRMRTVSILFGLTNNTDDVVANTLPTPLTPGSHLFGSVAREFRTRFVKPPLASFGLFTSSRSFLVSNIISLITDPSPLVPRAENTATLRLYGQNDFSDWIITEDYREKSVWGGFAAVGGFWTFINGIFGLFFGCSLLLILFGIKPFSIFGIVHAFQRDQLREAWHADFPRLGTEGGLPGSEQAGLVAFLRERLIDIDPINGEAGGDIESQTDPRLAIYLALNAPEIPPSVNEPKSPSDTFLMR